jgi:hypothetical protein
MKTSTSYKIILGRGIHAVVNFLAVKVSSLAQRPFK